MVFVGARPHIPVHRFHVLGVLHDVALGPPRDRLVEFLGNGPSGQVRERHRPSHWVVHEVVVRAKWPS